MRYRISLNINGTWQQFNPKGLDKLAVLIKKENDKIFYRKELQGDLVFTGEEFNTLYAIEQDYERCTPIPLKLEEKCGNTWNVTYLGELNLNDGEWFVDNCQLTIKVAKADAYACLTKKWTEKVNMLHADLQLTKHEIRTVAGQLEYLECSGSDRYEFCGNGSPDDEAWQWCKMIGWPTPNGIEYKTTWVREIRIVPSSQSLPAPYILLYDNGTEKKYAKRATVYGYASLPPDDVYSDFEYAQVLGETGGLQTFDNGVKLNDLLVKLVSMYCPSLTVKSDFLQINPDNPSLTNYVTGQLSKVMSLILFQKSDIKRHNAQNNATKAEVSLEDLLKLLDLLFQVKFEIDGNYLRLEHISYFSRSTGLDLTHHKYKQWMSGKYRYSYDRDKMPRIETFKLRQARGVDFIGLPIEYESPCVNQDEKNNKAEYASDLFITDVSSCLNEGNSTENLDGIVVIATEQVTTPQNTTALAIITEAALIGGSIPELNNSLAWAQLHRDYFQHNRVLYYGKLNGQLTQFLSVRRSKKGVKVKIPLCCEDTFSERDLVITKIGIGEVDQARYDVNEQTLELDLMYEGDLPPQTNQPPVANDDTFNVQYETTQVMNVAANDVDTNGNLFPCQIIITQPPTKGVIISTTNDGKVAYYPNAGYTGADQFKYRIKDNLGAQSNEATVNINVLIPNTPPDAQNDAYTTVRNTTLSINSTNGVLANDTNWQGQGTFQITSYQQNTAQGGTVTLNPNGSFNYTPPAGFIGVDTFTYTITSQTGYSDTATVSIEVKDPSSLPYARIRAINEQDITHPDGHETRADIVIEFFADAGFTQPVSVANLSANYRELYRDYLTGIQHQTNKTAICNGHQTVVESEVSINGRFTDENGEYISWYKFEYVMLAGVGYNI